MAITLDGTAGLAGAATGALNGTLGATTPSTVVATTITATGLTASQAVFTDASKNLVSVYPTVFIGGLTRVANATNSSVSYTGVGFKPSAIYFMTDLATGGTGHGFSNGTAQRATTSESGVSVGTITTGCCYYTAGAGTQTLIGNLTSMDADGFTISWAHVGLGASTIVISYMAFR